VTQGLTDVHGVGMFHSLYDVGDLIGRGAFSLVYLCRRKETQQVFAVKVINKALCVKKKTLRDEITVLLRVKHANIISLEEVYESDTEILLVMERSVLGWPLSARSAPRLDSQLLFTCSRTASRGASSSTVSCASACTRSVRPPRSWPTCCVRSSTCTRATSCIATSSRRTSCSPAATAATSSSVTLASPRSWMRTTALARVAAPIRAAGRTTMSVRADCSLARCSWCCV
jgi:hypothetical protein